MKIVQTTRDKMIWTGLGLGAAAITAMLTRQGMKAGWKAALGDEPPENPISADTTWRDALLWTTALALGAGISRLIVERLAAQVWVEKTGRKPPGL